MANKQVKVPLNFDNIKDPARAAWVAQFMTEVMQNPALMEKYDTACSERFHGIYEQLGKFGMDKYSAFCMILESAFEGCPVPPKELVSMFTIVLLNMITASEILDQFFASRSSFTQSEIDTLLAKCDTSKGN
jgi:hypothetical protein